MKQLTWPAVALIGVIGGVLVALAAFTDWGSGEIIAVAGILAGIGGGAAVAGGVAGKVEEVRAETSAQTDQLTNIERQTNGLATAERKSLIVEALDEHERRKTEGNL